MKEQSCWRLVGGITASVLFVLVLVAHLAGWIEIDGIILTLLICVIGSVAFALSQKMGIAKITAGPLEIETVQLIEQAVAELPPGQEAEVWRVLNKHSDLFPVTGVRLLWVDDHPESLIPQRRLLRRLGVEIVTARSTDAAIDELTRDGDFTLIIQDRLRHGRVDDAQGLVEWLKTQGPEHNVDTIPLVVFTWDVFDESIEVKEWNWIRQDFASLLNYIANEIQQWRTHAPVARDKPLTP
jgi:CheY-like chemotaxis protein